VSAEEYEALLGFYPLITDAGDIVPRTEMTVLANLLEHPAIESDVVEGPFYESRAIKRSSEDLGRVLAIARLSEEAAIAAWPAAWEEALKACFHSRWESLGQRAGAGLRALLASDRDMKEAHAACANGLLAAIPVTAEQLRLTGLRLLQDAIEPLEHSAGGWDHSPPG
jgi:hypothetical protein